MPAMASSSVLSWTSKLEERLETFSPFKILIFNTVFYCDYMSARRLGRPEEMSVEDVGM